MESITFVDRRLDHIQATITVLPKENIMDQFLELSFFNGPARIKLQFSKEEAREIKDFLIKNLEDV